MVLIMGLAYGYLTPQSILTGLKIIGKAAYADLEYNIISIQFI